MADPMSTASAVAGIVSLGITVCQSLINYISSVSVANEVVTRTLDSVATLRDLLELLVRPLHDTNFDRATRQRVQACMLDCRNGIELLQKKSEKLINQGKNTGKLKTTIQKAVFPFRESTLVRTQEVCRDLQDNLVAALGLLQMLVAPLPQA